MTTKEIMKLCQARANTSMELEIGRPFGAVVTRNGDIIAIAGDTTIRDHDPTAHAVINAIRTASKYLGTTELFECEMWTVGYPCPMCMTAIITAGIKTLHVSGSIEDCDDMGFDYTSLYEFIKTRDDSKILEIIPADEVYASKVTTSFTQKVEALERAAAEYEMSPDEPADQPAVEPEIVSEK